MIGPRLREARLARHLSLNAIAEKAEISVATLSRIERDQQRIDVELLLTLMRILKLDAHDVLGEESKQEERGVDPIAAKITALPAEERTKLWRALSTSRKAQRANAPARVIAQQVDEFLAQIDFLRAEIEAVRKKLR
jgi:transcriptional regulator with XRE-family HTH domain